MKTLYKVRSSDRDLWYGTFKTIDKAKIVANQYSKKEIVIVEVDELGKELTGIPIYTGQQQQKVK